LNNEYFASGFPVPFGNYRMPAFGRSLIPFMFGVGFLFFDALAQSSPRRALNSARRRGG
jgi:hypothetical protein